MLPYIDRQDQIQQMNTLKAYHHGLHHIKVVKGFVVFYS